MTFILKTLPLPKSNEVAAQHSIPAHAGCPYSIQRKPLLSSTISQYAHQTARIQSARNDCRCVTFVPDDSFFLTVHWHNSRRSCGVQSPNATPSLGRNQSLLQSPTTTPTSSSFVSLQHSRASSVNLLITITQCVVTMKRALRTTTGLRMQIDYLLRNTNTFSTLSENKTQIFNVAKCTKKCWSSIVWCWDFSSA